MKITFQTLFQNLKFISLYYRKSMCSKVYLYSSNLILIIFEKLQISLQHADFNCKSNSTETLHSVLSCIITQLVKALT